MATLAKTARAAHILLTALLTLLAGSPRVQCRCPDGTLKPFCLSFLFRTSALACCCAEESPASRGRCCGASLAAPTGAAECACCAHRGRPRTDETPDGAAIGGPSCVKTLVGSDNLAPTPSETCALTDLVWGDALSPPEPTALTSISDHALIRGQSHFLAPPPTDLVTVLQRFLI